MADDTLRGQAADEPELQEIASVRHYGFWLYVMSDCLLFASLFATYAVLNRSYAGGPTGSQVFDLAGVLMETSALLVSSFTYGLAVLALKKGSSAETLLWLGVTFVLGASFVGLEISEFTALAAEGSGPERSAFLSSFFGLVGTHGLHVTFGLIWMAVMMAQVVQKGLTAHTGTRIMLLSLFWHFLDIVWINIFTFVYLMGVLQHG